MNTYAIICDTFGRKFSFNAKDEKEAAALLASWVRYHSHDIRDYKIALANEPYHYQDLHNEYVR
jgi:hypothetical protein